MAFPFVEIGDAQSEMVVSVPARKGFVPSRNQVKFLLRPQPEPGSGKIEGRTRDRFEAKCVLVEFSAAGQVGDVNGDVIEFENGHAIAAGLSQRQRLESMGGAT